jgi:hypothetical protein
MSVKTVLTALFTAFCLQAAAQVESPVATDTTTNKNAVTAPGDTALHKVDINAPANDSAVVLNKYNLRFFVKEPIAKRAAMYSALVPGLGQLYNRQYWKVPLVYAAVGASAYFFVTNLQKYHTYREAYIYRVDGNPATNITDERINLYSDNDLLVLRNQYRQYLDYTVLFSALGYTLQILDAMVWAHLKNFDISQDLSMHPTIKAGMLPNGQIQPQVGFALHF